LLTTENSWFENYATPKERNLALYVPLHDNLGEAYRDNLGESPSSARICVGLTSISAAVRRQDEAQWRLGSRAEAASGSGGKGPAHA